MTSDDKSKLEGNHGRNQWKFFQNAFGNASLVPSIVGAANHNDLTSILNLRKENNRLQTVFGFELRSIKTTT